MPDDDDVLKTLTTAITDLAKNQENMSTMFTQLAQGQQLLQQSVQTMSTSLSEGIKLEKPTEPKEKNELGDDPSMQEVSSFILGEVKTLIEGNEKKHAESMETLATKLNRSDRASEIDKVRSTDGNEDFDQWLPEMTELSRLNPTLDVNDILILARQKNPTKLEEIKEVTRKKEEADKPKEEASTFTGLTPTSDSSFNDVKDDKDEKGSTTMEEALNKAYSEVVPKEVDGQFRAGDPLF